MSWSIRITAPSGMPDVQESIISVSSCAGNFYTAVRDLLEDRRLLDMTREEAIEALIAVINEVDKGNEGHFSNNYAVDADEQWSKGRESHEGWEKYRPYIDRMMPFKTYEEYCGYEMRNRIREAALRFLLYYKAGYEISYTW